ncbi:O-antigen ligase family protein [Fictibacillus sp. UD]|uniref:O-antigen ligase family protein n=1 Tax=Fictibacillus sp. UD TaxID=3038777 RepID=UPI003745297E
MTKSTYHFFNKYFFDISIFLCFVLPPIGIALLLFAGCRHLHLVWKEGKRVSITPGLFLLGCLFISSIGAALLNQEYSYFLISALLLSYTGLYLKIKIIGAQKTFSSLKWLTICGGVYFYALYPFQDFLMKNMLVSYLTGTALIGQTEFQQGYERLMGAAYNPNFSVALLLFGLSFLLGECLKSMRGASYRKLALQAVVAGMLVHAIYLTGSKAGFGILLIIFTLFIFRWNRLYAMFLVFMMAINIHLILEWMPRKARLFESADIRKVIWERAIHLWQENDLFGVTPIGFYKHYLSLYNHNIPHAHNMIIGMFVEYGSLGGVALLIVISIHLYRMFSPQVALIAIILLASWEKYTPRLSLVHPRILSYTRKWSWDVSVKTTKNKEYL